MKVEAWDEAHGEAVAELLAAAQRDGSVAPGSGFSDPIAAAQALSPGAVPPLSAVAVDGGRVAGFVMSPLPDPLRPARIRISDLHHAAVPDAARPAYRDLYGWLSAHLVRHGCFDHRFLVLARPPETMAAFFELGFGIDQVKGVLPIGSARPNSAAEPATAEDEDELVGLWIELAQFHARPPILDPARLHLPSMRTDLRSAIADENRAVLVVRRAGRVVGMTEAHPDSRYPHTICIGLNVVTETERARGIGSALLDGIAAWARERGAGFLSVSWASANPVSDAFYRARGFAPVRYELARRIDTRISWADAERDLSAYRAEP